VGFKFLIEAVEFLIGTMSQGQNRGQQLDGLNWKRNYFEAVGVRVN
jgi:hypothetical protein